MTSAVVVPSQEVGQVAPSSTQLPSALSVLPVEEPASSVNTARELPNTMVSELMPVHMQTPGKTAAATKDSELDQAVLDMLSSSLTIDTSGRSPSNLLDVSTATNWGDPTFLNGQVEVVAGSTLTNTENERLGSRDLLFDSKAARNSQSQNAPTAPFQFGFLAT